MKNKIPFSADPADDGEQELEGDGTGVGYNLGLHIRVTDHISFGAAYRSEVEMDLGGADVQFSDIPGAAQPLFSNTKATATIKLPAQLVAAIAAQVTESFLVEAGLRWEEWSTFDELVIELDQAVAGATSSVTPRDWDDTFAFNLGTRYQLNNTLTLLAGYLYGDSPVPDNTFEPAIPDSRTHLFTIGTDIDLDRLTLSLSYGYQLQEDRTKNNDIGAAFGAMANGEYDNDIHLAAVSATYRF